MAGGIGGFGGDGGSCHIRYSHGGGELIISRGHVNHTGALFDREAVGIDDVKGHPGKLKIVACHHADPVARDATVTRCMP